MLVHIIARDPVADALEREGREEPIENRRRSAGQYGLIQTRVLAFGVNLVEKGCRSRYRTNGPN